jgi:short-subunit dehydrogenase
MSPSTVLITGASSGLGAVFAKAYAERGHDLVIIARRKEKLEALKATLENKHNVTVHVVVEDLSTPDAASRIATHVADLPIGVLINNAGFGDLAPVTKANRNKLMNMIAVNVCALTELTPHMLPILQKTADPHILNVASTAAYQPGPDMAVYFATKAYVLSFSEALAHELRKRITVTTLCPGATKTEFDQAADMGDSALFKGTLMSAEAVVAAAMYKMDRGGGTVVPGAKNKLLVWSNRLVPRNISAAIVHQLIKSNRF